MGSRNVWTDILETAALVGTFIPSPVVKVLSMGVGMVISSLGTKSSQPPVTSESYSWSQAPNKTAANGTPMPVIYGKTRVKPILKNRFITMEGKKQWLYALYSFAGHLIDERTVGVWTVGAHYVHGDEVTNPIEPGKTYICKYPHTAVAVITGIIKQYPLFTPTGALTPAWVEGKGTAAITGLCINGEDVSGLNQYGVEYWTRPGLPQQSILPNMNQTFSNTAQDISLNTTYPTPMYVMGSGPDRTFIENYILGHRAWKAHHIFYDGVAYPMRGGGLTPSQYNSTVYMYWFKPVGGIAVADAYYVSTTPDPQSTTFLIGTWKKSGKTPVFDWEAHTPEEVDWSTHTNSTATTQNIQVEFTLPDGLIGATDKGSPTSALGKIFVQYRRVWGDGAFGSNYGTSVTGTWENGIEADRHKGNPFDKVVAWNSSLTGYKTCTEGTLVRKTTTAINIILKVVDDENPLDEGMYQVRVAAFAAAEVTLLNIAAITYGDFTYPGEPLLGLKVLASNKFSTDIEVTAVCERSKVWGYNTRNNTWVQGAANNPAWAVYDLLAQGDRWHPTTRWPADGFGVAGAQGQMATYGCGLNVDKLDYETFRAWAEYMDTLGYKLNTVFDSPTTIWDAVQRICTEFMGMVLPVGTKYYAILDRAETPAQLFSVGNIVEGTFQATWPDRSKRAGSIAPTFSNGSTEQDYKPNTFLIRGTGWDTKETLNMTLYGTTDYNQAYKIGRFFLTCNELLVNVVEFEVGVGDMQVGVGDVVYVQHDVPKWWGVGGRVADYRYEPISDDWAVILDKTMTLVPATAYDIYLKHQDTDLVEVHRVTGYSGDVDYIFLALTHTAWVQTPKAEDVWAVQVTSLGLPQFRVIDVARTSDLNKRLTLLQYDQGVYETGLVIPVITGGVYKTVALAYNTATGVRLSEALSRRTTGEYQSNINVVWEAGQGADWGEWDVIFRDVDASDIGWVREWTPGTYNQYDKVIHEGGAYISLIDNNTATPGA